MMEEKAEFALLAAFTNTEAGMRGNVAAVVMCRELPRAGEMQKMAADLNQPATTFLAPSSIPFEYHTRWFAPDSEIGLCGHGTFVAAAFLSRKEGNHKFTFSSPGGILTGQAHREKISIELDAIPVSGQEEIPPLLPEALGIPVTEYYSTGNKYIVVTDQEKSVRDMQPDFARLRQLPVFGYAVTAPGTESDFVSRTLVPHVQQLEDHATGSSHAALFAFWAERLGKSSMQAMQLSPRGGWFMGEVDRDLIRISGYASFIAAGKIYI